MSSSPLDSRSNGGLRRLNYCNSVNDLTHLQQTGRCECSRVPPRPTGGLHCLRFANCTPHPRGTVNNNDESHPLNTPFVPQVLILRAGAFVLRGLFPLQSVSSQSGRKWKTLVIPPCDPALSLINEEQRAKAPTYRNLAQGWARSVV